MKKINFSRIKKNNKLWKIKIKIKINNISL
jgi:hypothetical protein